MGHEHITGLRKSREWNGVVAMLRNGGGVANVAQATSVAAAKALLYVQHDPGFKEAVHLMAQLGVAATKPDPVAHLASVGIELSVSTSLADVVAAVAETLDRRVDGTRKRSDFAELAQRALVGAVCGLLRDNQMPLFDSTHQDVTSALSELRKEKAFGKFSTTFFAKLTNGCLDYFLSKTLALQVGEGQPFATMNQIAQFDAALDTHCREVAVIVQKFSGEWFSKQLHEGGGNISRDVAEGFGWYAMEKIQAAMKENSSNAN
jgi:hypothetical protein